MCQTLLTLLSVRWRNGSTSAVGHEQPTDALTFRVDSATAGTNLHHSYGNSINITGGGAFKFEPMIRDRLGFTVHKVDEMEMAIAGLNFLTHYVKQEVFSYSWRTHEQTFHDAASLGGIYPYLLVNIGSGVSILRCTSRDSFERVSGTSLGGGMFWGLCKLLTGVTSFEQVKQLSSEGDNSKVDLLVGDIYGTAYSKIGLSANVIASSFGKLAALDRNDKSWSDADLIRSLLFMTTNNIAQIAYLNAQRYKVARVFFCGNFINRNPYIWDRLSYAMDFWSKQKMQALFLAHDGYLGALGAFLASSNFAWASPRATPPLSEEEDDEKQRRRIG
jgi:pantothenate kinase